jgi:hypothetical protein
MDLAGGRTSRRLTGLIAALATAVVGSVLAAPLATAGTDSGSTPQSRHDSADMVNVQFSVADTADTYIASAAPKRAHGDYHKLVATDDRNNTKVVFVKFRVHGVPSDGDIKTATVQFTRDYHHMPDSRLSLYRVNPYSWTQAGLDDRHAPRLGELVDTTHSSRPLRTVSFAVQDVVRHDGLYAFAVTSSNRNDVVRFQSQEAQDGPQLDVVAEHPVVPDPDPTPTPTATPTDTPTPSPTPTPTDTPTASPSASPSSSPTSSPSCTLSATLVPSCGVLFGGALTTWGGADIKSQYDDALAGTGTHVTLDHDYRRPGDVLSPYDIALMKTPGAILQLNWKPATRWSLADGSSSTVNAQIDAMANSIKALAPHKLFLTIYHEPENDVSGGATNCPGIHYKGSAGTPAEFRAMWANVEARFAALGVTNVVWDMNYMNYASWDCMVDDLWPGNDLVDWIFFESYSDDNSTFQGQTSHFYNLLTSHSDATHDYLSKPWGVGELGTDASTASARDSYFSGVKTAIDHSTFPNLKLYSVFDADTVGPDFRVNRTPNSQVDPLKLADFMKLATDPQVEAGESAAAGN